MVQRAFILISLKSELIGDLRTT